MTAHPPFRPPRWRPALLAGAALLAAGGAGAPQPIQNPVDRADPSVVERQLGIEERHLQPPAAPLPAALARGDAAVPEGPPIVAGAIRIDGATALPPSAFAAAIEPWLGRPLGAAELRTLAR